MSDSGSERGDGGWAPYPDVPGVSDPGSEPAVEPAAPITGPVTIVGLGAICDLVRVSEDGRSVNFSVSEFAELGDGRRVTLHTERGYTIGWGGRWSGTPDITKSLTAESITHDVLNVVLPDEDDTGEDHPWDWLAGLAHARGLDVTADELRVLPYEVVLSDGVIHLL